MRRARDTLLPVPRVVLPVGKRTFTALLHDKLMILCILDVLRVLYIVQCVLGHIEGFEFFVASALACIDQVSYALFVLLGRVLIAAVDCDKL